MNAVTAKAAPKTVESILDYLQHRMPAYPFDNKLDADFVRELVEDFQDVDILEETKGFRWFYSNQPIQPAPCGCLCDAGSPTRKSADSTATGPETRKPFFSTTFFSFPPSAPESHGGAQGLSRPRSAVGKP